MCFDTFYLNAYEDLKSLDNVDMNRLTKCLKKSKVCMFFSHINQYTLRTAVSIDENEEFDDLKDISHVDIGPTFYEIKSHTQMFYIYMKCFIDNEVKILIVKKQRMRVGEIIELTKNNVLRAIKDFSGGRKIAYKSEDIIIFKDFELGIM